MKRAGQIKNNFPATNKWGYYFTVDQSIKIEELCAWTRDGGTVQLLRSPSSNTWDFTLIDSVSLRAGNSLEWRCEPLGTPFNIWPAWTGSAYHYTLVVQTTAMVEADDGNSQGQLIQDTSEITIIGGRGMSNSKQ